MKGASIPTKSSDDKQRKQPFLSTANRARYRRVKAWYNGDVYLYRQASKTCLQLKYESVQQGKKGREKRGLEKPSLIVVICQNIVLIESELR